MPTFEVMDMKGTLFGKRPFRSSIPTVLPALVAGILFVVCALGIPDFARADNNTALNAAESAPKAAPAETQQTAARKPAPSAAPAANALPVYIEHDGTDKSGLRLAMKLKDSFEQRKEFRLAEKNEKAIKLVLSTKVEIPERPYFGSVYSVVWLYVEGKDVLAYYLDDTLDFTASQVLDEDVEALVARTSKVAEKYSYLME